MKISVKNVGILGEAKVDLSKKLIVLSGPNNAGKTYAAYAIYGLLKTAVDLRAAPGRASLAKKIQAIAENTWSIDILKLLEEDDFAFVKEYIGIFKDALSDVFAAAKDTFADAAMYADIDLNTDLGFFKKNIEENEIDISYQMLPRHRYNFKKSLGETSLTSTLIIQKTEDGKGEPSGNQRESVQKTVFEIIIPNLILGTLFPKTFILPTQRTAINVFNVGITLKNSQVLNLLGSLRSQLTEIDIKAKTSTFFREIEGTISRDVRRYTMPIRDSLTVANDLANLDKRKSEFSSLADELERSILKGAITVSQQGELLFTPHGYDNTSPLSVNLWGSMVSSLASLVFYLRRSANKGDFIIFDEPELNLHPDNQILIARFLGTLINAGFSLLVSTHSDYVIRELNNLIMLNGIADDEFTKMSADYGYEENHKIKADEIQVLYFAPKKDGENPNTKITAISLGIDDKGFEVETIDWATEKLNNSTDDILFAERKLA